MLAFKKSCVHEKDKIRCVLHLSTFLCSSLHFSLRVFAKEVRHVQRQICSGTSCGRDLGRPGIFHELAHARVLLHLWKLNAVSGVLHEERHRRRHHLQVRFLINNLTDLGKTFLVSVSSTMWIWHSASLRQWPRPSPQSSSYPWSDTRTLCSWACSAPSPAASSQDGPWIPACWRWPSPTDFYKVWETWHSSPISSCPWCRRDSLGLGSVFILIE